MCTRCGIAVDMMAARCGAWHSSCIRLCQPLVEAPAAEGVSPPTAHPHVLTLLLSIVHAILARQRLQTKGVDCGQEWGGFGTV